MAGVWTGLWNVGLCEGGRGDGRGRTGWGAGVHAVGRGGGRGESEEGRRRWEKGEHQDKKNPPHTKTGRSKFTVSKHDDHQIMTSKKIKL